MSEVFSVYTVLNQRVLVLCRTDNTWEVFLNVDLNNRGINLFKLAIRGGDPAYHYGIDFKGDIRNLLKRGEVTFICYLGEDGFFRENSDVV